MAAKTTRKDPVERKEGDERKKALNAALASIEKQFGKKIDKKKISLKTEIKNFGTYEAEIRLYNGVTAKVTVDVTES